jgi:LPXTG-motif cell wall-anchored protein
MNGGHRQFIQGIGIAASCFVLFAGCGTRGTDQGNTAKSDSDVLEHVTEKGPVKLAVRIKPREPRLSDLVDMEIEVTAPPDVEIKPPAFGQAVGDFLVRDYSEGTGKKQAESTDGTSTRRFRYQLEPVHAGRHLIRSIAIEFVDNRPDSEAKGKTTLIESDPLEVEITSELGDQVPDLANLEPMAPPQPLAGSSQWTWVLIAGGAVAAVLFAVWLLRRRKVRVKEPRRLTPEEIAHAALLGLLSENLPSQGLFKDFYLRLTGIVRQYIEDTTGLKAPEQTTEEFLRDMRSKNVFPAERSVRLKEFLEAADMVKYAGQQPGEEQIELSIARAREFVDLRGGLERA